MSVLISFPSGRDWFKANWVFRQLAEDVTRCYSDPQMKRLLDEAQWFGGLEFTKIESGLSRKMMAALRAVAFDTINGRIGGWRPEDPHEHELYCEAMSELVAVIDQQIQPTT